MEGIGVNPAKPAEENPVQTTLVQEDRQKLLQMSEISLILDTYEDIFSDFDPRPYSQRTISDDFLYAAKKASREKVSGIIELRFLIPANQRNKGHETIIKRRLKEHFSKHYDLLEKESKSMAKQGLLFVILGVILMFIATFILFNYRDTNLFTNFIVILLEPASWFLFWEGSRQVLFESKNKKPDLEFYKKMSKCEIDFLSY